MARRGSVKIIADSTPLDNAALSWMDNVGSSITDSLLPRVGKYIVESFQAQMLENLNAAQAKSKSQAPITSSGGTEASISDENWVIAVEGQDLTVAWIPTGLEIGGYPYGRLFAIDFGIRVPQTRNTGYNPQDFRSFVTRKDFNTDSSYDQLTGSIRPPTRDEFKKQNEGFEEGPFRQAIKAWVAEKQLPVHYMTIVHSIMGDQTADQELGGEFEPAPIDPSRRTQPSLPKFLAGTADAIFDAGEGDTFPYEFLTSTGESLVTGAIARALADETFPKLKRTKGKRGKRSVTEQELMTLQGELITSTHRGKSGQPYTMYSAVVRDARGRFSSVIGTGIVR